MATTSTPGYDPTPEEVEFETRAEIASLWTGGRLFIGMYAFLLASLAFAYFYLRSSNNGDLWRPGNITAPTAFGWAIACLVVLSALLMIFGQWRLRKGIVLDWEVAGWLALTSALAALGVQIWQLTDLPFYPGSSGYASCFIGWAVVSIMTIAIMAYWIETALARSIRMRSEQGPGAQLSSSEDGRVFRAGIDSCTYFMGFAALGFILFLALFYLL